MRKENKQTDRDERKGKTIIGGKIRGGKKATEEKMERKERERKKTL